MTAAPRTDVATLMRADFVVKSAADAVTRRQRENEERALVYVSLTRARKLAYVFGYGRMSEWFEGLC